MYLRIKQSIHIIKEGIHVKKDKTIYSERTPSIYTLVDKLISLKNIKIGNKLDSAHVWECLVSISNI